MFTDPVSDIGGGVLYFYYMVVKKKLHFIAVFSKIEGNCAIISK
jgi:hypothetical protein